MLRPGIFFIGILISLATPALVSAQIGNDQGLKRTLGSEPPALEAIFDQDLQKLKRLWAKNRQDFFARGHLGRSVFHVASIVGNPAIMEFLIDKKINLNVTDIEGNSPLHYAAWQGNTKILSLLIDAEGDINAQNSNGEVPLFHAIRKGNWDTTVLLLDAGADTELTDYTARGLMDYAKDSEDRQLFRKLRKRGL